MLEWIHSPEAWVALLTLTALEIVLGIDNIIFISIVVERLPEHQQQRARLMGLSLAMGMRIALLFCITWIMQLTQPWFHIWTEAISGRDLILFLGGLFLLFKSTHEIHQSFDAVVDKGQVAMQASFAGVLLQIALLDLVFSLDSVITAVGLVNDIPIMVIAIVIAIIVMMIFAKAISDFVQAHPTIKMLALSFLILIGTALVAESLDFHIPRGYIYFAMGFSVMVECLNLRLRKKVEAR